MQLRSVLLAGVLGLAVSGCGGEEDDPNAEFKTCDEGLCATLTVPADYAGTARALGVAFYQSYPPTTAPKFFFQRMMPEIGVDKPYRLKLTADELKSTTGDYYVVFVLYDVAGGTTFPHAGKDHRVDVTTPVTFGGSAVDLGERALALVQ